MSQLLPIVHSAPAVSGPIALSDKWDPQPAQFGKGMPRRDSAEILSGHFTFLNKGEPVGFPPDWHAHGQPKLWQYNLHYFEYLWSLAFADSAQIALDWINRHPFGRYQVGWEPYPTSLRLQNWCGYFLGVHIAETTSDPKFFESLLQSMAVQALHLERSIEYHLLGNHLLENAASLALVGSCLGGRDADRQYRLGLELLEEQLAEQILPDGVHFERSPMYHARLTYLLSQLRASGDSGIRTLVDAPLNKMKKAAGLMAHPDGQIALFNDAAFEIAPRPADLDPEPTVAGVFSLSDAGYFGIRTIKRDYLLLDAGPVGPDYLPGHAHGDIFSFELSLRGARVIVDSGTHDYQASDMRRYCRSTGAHNTVEIDGVDQCEFWGVFRVARRARPHDVRFEEGPDGFLLSGWHDGYRRLAGNPAHERSARWTKDGVLVVKDRILASKSTQAVSRLHFHPDCEIVDLDDSAQRVTVRYPNGSCVIAWQGEGRLATEDSWYCPEFGIRLRNQALAFSSSGPCETVFCIAPDEQNVTFEI